MTTVAHRSVQKSAWKKILQQAFSSECFSEQLAPQTQIDIVVRDIMPDLHSFPYDSIFSKNGAVLARDFGNYMVTVVAKSLDICARVVVVCDRRCFAPRFKKAEEQSRATKRARAVPDLPGSFRGLSADSPCPHTPTLWEKREERSCATEWALGYIAANMYMRAGQRVIFAGWEGGYDRAPLLLTPSTQRLVPVPYLWTSQGEADKNMISIVEKIRCHAAARAQLRVAFLSVDSDLIPDTLMYWDILHQRLPKMGDIEKKEFRARLRQTPPWDTDALPFDAVESFSRRAIYEASDEEPVNVFLEGIGDGGGEPPLLRACLISRGRELWIDVNKLGAEITRQVFTIDGCAVPNYVAMMLASGFDFTNGYCGVTQASFHKALLRYGKRVIGDLVYKSEETGYHYRLDHNAYRALVVCAFYVRWTGMPSRYRKLSAVTGVSDDAEMVHKLIDDVQLLADFVKSINKKTRKYDFPAPGCLAAEGMRVDLSLAYSETAGALGQHDNVWLLPDAVEHGFSEDYLMLGKRSINMC